MANVKPSPRGRLVQMAIWKPFTTDQQGQPLTVKTGPNAGQPRESYLAAVAFPKGSAEETQIVREIKEAAAAAWPRFFPSGPFGPCTHPKFAFKFTDGDGVDDNGKQNATKEGWAGHTIVKFSSSFKPDVFNKGEYDPMQVIRDERALKNGYFVKVGYSIESNMNDQRPGMYVNLHMVSIEDLGPEIVSGPSAADVFGNSSTTAPPPPGPVTHAPGSTQRLVATGAHSIEVLRTGGWTDEQLIAAGHAKWENVAPPVPPSPAPAPPVPSVPTPGASTPPIPAPPGATPSPTNYQGYMQTGPRYEMLPPAQGASREDLHKAGWTDDLLVQHGFMRIFP